jgi:hypothetical protein
MTHKRRLSITMRITHPNRDDATGAEMDATEAEMKATEAHLR